MGEQVTDQDIVNSTLNETVTRVTKVSASFEGMSIAYASLFIMAVVPIFIGSRRSLSHHQRHKVSFYSRSMDKTIFSYIFVLVTNSSI